MHELNLTDTTSDEVLRRLPAATVVTEHADGRAGGVLVTVEAESENGARQIAEDAGFAVA